MTSKEIVYFYMQIKGINFKLCFGFIFTIHFDKITSKIKKKLLEILFSFFYKSSLPSFSVGPMGYTSGSWATTPGRASLSYRQPISSAH